MLHRHALTTHSHNNTLKQPSRSVVSIAGLLRSNAVRKHAGSPRGTGSSSGAGTPEGFGRDSGTPSPVASASRQHNGLSSRASSAVSDASHAERSPGPEPDAEPDAEADADAEPTSNAEVTAALTQQQQQNEPAEDEAECGPPSPASRGRTRLLLHVDTHAHSQGASSGPPSRTPATLSRESGVTTASLGMLLSPMGLPTGCVNTPAGHHKRRMWSAKSTGSQPGAGEEDAGWQPTEGAHIGDIVAHAVEAEKSDNDEGDGGGDNADSDSSNGKQSADDSSTDEAHLGAGCVPVSADMQAVDNKNAAEAAATAVAAAAATAAAVAQSVHNTPRRVRLDSVASSGTARTGTGSVIITPRTVGGVKARSVASSVASRSKPGVGDRRSPSPNTDSEARAVTKQRLNPGTSRTSSSLSLKHKKTPRPAQFDPSVAAPGADMAPVEPSHYSFGSNDVVRCPPGCCSLPLFPSLIATCTCACVCRRPLPPPPTRVVCLSLASTATATPTALAFLLAARPPSTDARVASAGGGLASFRSLQRGAGAPPQRAAASGPVSPMCTSGAPPPCRKAPSPVWVLLRGPRLLKWCRLLPCQSHSLNQRCDAPRLLLQLLLHCLPSPTRGVSRVPQQCQQPPQQPW